MISSYVASRLAGGHFFFPLELYLYPDRITVRRPGFLSSVERSIPLAMVACITLRTGILFASARIESSGGTEDIVATGFRKRDMVQFKEDVEALLTEATASGGSQAGPFSDLGLKLCPYCAESIQQEAIKCRYCGEMLAT